MLNNMYYSEYYMNTVVTYSILNYCNSLNMSVFWTMPGALIDAYKQNNTFLCDPNF